MVQTTLKGNFALNVIGMTLPIGVTLITVPIYIAHIGAARYGVLSIVWLFLGYFGFLDFGLSRASTKALANLATRPIERSRIFVTALHLNLAFGICGALIIYLAGKLLLGHMFSMSDPLSAEVQAVIPWIACMLPMALVAGIGRGSIEAREHFFNVNLLDLTGVVFGTSHPGLMRRPHQSNIEYRRASGFRRQGHFGGLNVCVHCENRGDHHFPTFDQSAVKELFGFGAGVSVTNVIGPVLSSVDQVFVGSTLGAAAVAHYSVPMNLVNRSQIIAAALARTLFPRFARLDGNEAMDLAERTLISLAYAFASICAPAIIVGNVFMIL